MPVDIEALTRPETDASALGLSEFYPEADALTASGPFAGALHISAARLYSVPASPRRHAGLSADTNLFPTITAAFASEVGDLIPVSEKPLLGFKDAADGSYWDVIVQKGRVWRLGRDKGWNRAAFPFALVNPLENDTYNGIALFGYRDGKVTPVRLWIVQQTAPFLLREHFVATGVAKAGFEPKEISASGGDGLHLRPWSVLEAKVGSSALSGFAAAEASSGLIASGIDIDGEFYLRRFDTPYGAWPYSNEARIGVWSVTKSSMTGLAALRLARLYGDEVLNEPVQSHVPELKGSEPWSGVTILNALCMATGVGSKADGYVPVGFEGDEIAPGYKAWYLAQSVDAKLVVIAEDAIRESWGPGKEFRYRDQDMFTAGVAMDRLSRARDGRSLEQVLQQDLYSPLGIEDPAFARSIEAAGVDPLPLWAFGFYPNLGELVRIARLIQARGRLDGKQLLSTSLIDKIFAAGGEAGLLTDRDAENGPIRYYLTFWCSTVSLPNGQTAIYPCMSGYGGNDVLLLPNGVTVIRIAKDQMDERPTTRRMAEIGMKLPAHQT